MELSSRVEYALLALLELASHSGDTTPLTIGQITAKQPIPDRYLEQILTGLRRDGIVQSQRGAKGGYVLARKPRQVSLLDVVASVEGDRKEKDHTNAVTLEKDVIHEVWQQASSASEAILSRCTLQDLCQQRDARQQTQPMYYI
nr:Rrf2 family transcriptional regulator [Stenomitos frigidus]